jgi:hypothetical protein
MPVEGGFATNGFDLSRQSRQGGMPLLDVTDRLNRGGRP